MVSISAASKEFWLSKKEFLDLVQEKTGKKYSEKTSRISDSIFEELKSSSDTDSTIKKSQENKSEKSDSDWGKVFTADDLLSQEDSFLSQLWFDSVDEETQEDSASVESYSWDLDTDKTLWTWSKDLEKASKDDLTSNFESTSDAPVEQETKPKISVVKKDKSSSAKPWANSTSGKAFSVKKKTFTKKDKKKWANTKVKEEEPIKKREVSPQVSSTLKKKASITIWDTISIKEFSEKMWVSLQEVMKKLLANKIMLPVTASIDFDTAVLIWEELWVKIEKEKETVSVSDILSWDIQSIVESDKDLWNLSVRAPIVTVMWHVDHGKTKLLDYLRKTDIVWWESGWITQSIWASQIHHNNNLITFIDTPWHELFTSLRARWSKITDVAIIVVAADDWIKQQTIEAINHAKDAWVPIIVAITKIDLPNANLELVKWNLAEHWLVPEDWGGETVVVPVSSMTWEWIDDLLEMISLQSEILELKYNPDRNWIGIVVESDKDAKKWITASIIMMTWNIKVWDVLVIWDVFWKVRRMTNWKHKDTKIAYGWEPVQILWIQDLPKPWTIVEVVDSEKQARTKISMIKDSKQEQESQVWVQNILDQISAWEKVQLKLILKSDSFWSLEALKYAIWKIDVHENVDIKVIHNDVWWVTDSDINLAKASDAFILWFNVSASWAIKKKAENQSVVIKSFDIIYELIDYVESIASWMIEVEKQEVYIWSLDLKAVFYRKASDMIIWWRVLDWYIQNWAYLRVYRSWEEDAVATGKVTSLKKEQENVDKISSGHDCWMKIKVNKKLQEWDKIDFYIME